jgi:hypothetical protein
MDEMALFDDHCVLLTQVLVELLIKLLALVALSLLLYALAHLGEYRRWWFANRLHIHQVDAIAGEHRSVPLPG